MPFDQLEVEFQSLVIPNQVFGQAFLVILAEPLLPAGIDVQIASLKAVTV
jgi:hypothetical protein